ncbi:hypothetical protein PRK78_000828 [Emydomyces testavorans]|uniref:Phosphatidate phosphatase APP1 catalytic domain-containing protein n=1 Tax=Emydomyces testavorans TaxID=2070801 RepID=A0AAF0DBD1_9EURO|nr:hypothetical protein PRK78_000828 [Emydomyces testavorans]
MTQLCETPDERRHRARGHFHRVESQLSVVHSVSSPKSFLISWAEYLASFLGWGRPQVGRADPLQHTVWLFDNTAFQPGADHHHERHDRWHAEVVAAIFHRHSRKDLGMLIALIADLIGVDGKLGENPAIRQRISERLQPFVSEVAPARFVTVDVPVTPTDVHKFKLNPSDKNGIISHAIHVESSQPIRDGAVTYPSLRRWPHPVTMSTTFAAPNGWLVVSDIDDTIKYTMTPDAIGILRTTFAEEPEPIRQMPELYVRIHKQLQPTWFYLSASPYNLYPFLRSFLEQHYPAGTMILRDTSWQSIAGLLKSFTQGTHAYKVDRMQKIQGWFPRRKILCIGDSTQSDPEAYAEMYGKYGHWIKAIYIRKVIDVPNMDEKNSPERFEKAFDNVPSAVWKVFENPEELYEAIDQLC